MVPATSTVRSSAWSGSRRDTTAKNPPSGSLVEAVCVVVEPFSAAVKAWLVASNDIELGATTSTVLRPASPTPYTANDAYPRPTRVESFERGASPGKIGRAHV